MELTPTAVEAGSRHVNITMTYTAVTDLMDANLQINPMGIVIVDDSATTTVTEELSDTSSPYGYVRPKSGDANKGTLTVSGTTIQWADLNLRKGQSVTTRIGPVRIMSATGKYTWDGYLANNNVPITAAHIMMDVDGGTSGNQPLDFYATSAASNGIAFAIDGPMDYPAGSKQIVKFQFTANATPIRDGYVRVRLPSGWTVPNSTLKGTAIADTKRTTDVDGKASVSVDGGTLEATALEINGHTITVNIDVLEQADTITITYGKTTTDMVTEAVIQNVAQDGVKIYGSSKAWPDTGEISKIIGVDVTNAPDGSGSATIIADPGGDTIQAGSSSSKIHVTFTAAGTMTDGHVLLELPMGWGRFQRDPVEPNYIEILGSGATLVEPAIGSSGNRAVAKINDRLGPTGSFSFIYGGGNGSDQNGVDAQDHLGPATFMIKSDGDGDTVSADLTSETKYDGTAAAQVHLRAADPHRLMNLYAGYPGQLRILVGGAAGGSGTAVVDKTEVNAANPVTLKFTYTATQTIQDGNLKLTVPGGWSMPQTDDPSQPGYTEATGSGIGIAADDNAMSIIVPITFINNGDTIVITYGLGGGQAVATTVDGDPDTFTIQIEGTAGSGYEKIGRSPAVTVNPQGAGKGTAVATVTADADGSAELYAGEASREIVVVYTAAGQMMNGQVKLTLPALTDGTRFTGWSPASADHVTAMSSAGNLGTPMYGADATPATQEVIVTGVNLPPNGTVTFVYTGNIGNKKADNVPFAVSTTGEITATTTTPTFAAVSGDAVTGQDATIDVGYAKAGSGMASVDMPVIAPSPAEGTATPVTLTFTYTAVGETAYPQKFRVRVPTGWSTEVTAADYAVVHKRGGVDTLTRTIETLPPVGNDMVARAKNVAIDSYRVQAGDKVVFTYTTTVPTDDDVYPFQVLFDGALVEGNTSVRVQGTSATALTVSSGGTVSADAGAAPLAITVGLVDDSEPPVMRATATAVMVTLTSSSTTGTFSKMMDEAGAASLMVEIPAGADSAMAYYSDSTVGTAAITATATGLTTATADVMVTTSVLAITSASADTMVAKDGDTVTVTAMATAGQTPTVTIASTVTGRPSIVMGGPMTEVSAGSGSYTRSDTLAAGTQEGTYDITVTLGTLPAMSAGMLTVDNTDPVVTVTAPESAANGDTVMISATVTDASAISSVMADVSMLDSTQTDPVALAMGDDGYSASITISDANENANGSKTITVTAMDAAGNSGMDEAAVELKNTLSYTSMIPTGISLYHVPLDVADIETVGDLKMKLGDAASLVIVYDHATSSWNSRSDDVMITADLGIVLAMTDEASVTFEGESWDGATGTATLSLSAGDNLIGLPVSTAGVTNVSDIIGLFSPGVVTSITTLVGSSPGVVTAIGTEDGGAVMGDAGYLVRASEDADAALIGIGWSNGGDAASAPVVLPAYNVGGQTAVLDVNGSVVDEITGLAREGFRVKVKNLSTKASLSKVTSAETVEGYNMTFVDLKTGHAARVGDVLEISADSPSPLIGVQSVRHIVTVDDVKSGILELENLIAYEIPAETELLRNYPNPFNPETWIPFRLAEDAFVTLTIYDGVGRVVRKLDVGHRIAGIYESRSKAIHWDGRNEVEEQVASDLYFYHLSAGDFSATRRMVIIK